MASAATRCADNFAEYGSEQCIAAAGGGLLSRAQRAGAGLAAAVLIEPLMHMLDAGFSYLEGVITGLQDFVQVVDAEHCSVPNYYLDQVWLCLPVCFACLCLLTKF